MANAVAGHLFPGDISAAFTRSKPPADAYLHSRGSTGTTWIKINTLMDFGKYREMLNTFNLLSKPIRGLVGVR